VLRNPAQTTQLYLGHLIGGDGIQPDPEKVDKLVKYEHPSTVKELRSFLGFASYYRRYIRNFARRAHALYELAKAAEWKWTPQCESTFNDLKSSISDLPLQVHFDPTYNSSNGCERRRTGCRLNSNA
jgi:hypothetical protein